MSTPGTNTQRAPDRELTDIADYVDGYRVKVEQAIDAARFERTAVHEFVDGLVI
jgi:hypothetical protein